MHLIRDFLAFAGLAPSGVRREIATRHHTLLLALALGRDDAAERWLRIAAQDAEPYLAWVRISPMCERLRGHAGAGEVKSLLEARPTAMNSLAGISDFVSY